MSLIDSIGSFLTFDSSSADAGASGLDASSFDDAGAMPQWGHDNTALLQDSITPDFDFGPGFGSTTHAFGASDLVSLPASTADQGSSFDWGEIATPDVAVFGYTQKPVAALGHANSLLTGNFALVGKDSTTYFHSHVVDKWPVGHGVLTAGPVGAWNNKSHEFEGGLGVGYKVRFGDIDGLLWANGRVNQSVLEGDGNFTISGNVGGAVSASDLAFKGASYLGGPAARLAVPQAMNIIDNAFSPDLWVGAGWRAELGIRHGELDSVNISGQHLNVHEFTDMVGKQFSAPSDAPPAQKFIDIDLGNTYDKQAYPF